MMKVNNNDLPTYLQMTEKWKIYQLFRKPN